MRGPNIVPFPQLSPLAETWRGEVWLKVGDNVTTDDILPGRSQFPPLRSNLPAISQFTFARLDPDFSAGSKGGVKGPSSAGKTMARLLPREHAALAPR